MRDSSHESHLSDHHCSALNPTTELASVRRVMWFPLTSVAPLRDDDDDDTDDPIQLKTFTDADDRSAYAGQTK